MLNCGLIQDGNSGGWWQFQDAREIIVIESLDKVLPALRQIEERVNGKGLWAAGFISYEAGPAFDPAIRVRTPASSPLLRMGLYPPPQLIQFPVRSRAEAGSPYPWQASVTRRQYERAIGRIREFISAGDTYQVNYTLRLHAPAQEDPEALFLRMVRANQPRYGAYLDCENFVICSASPELFFRLDGERITSRPMKGTAGRGMMHSHDSDIARALAASEKDRAENVMIVDMVRNDLSRISRTGSVQVPQLFELERYPTLWQLTSTVTADTDASVCDILRALFPPASITGAPKARTTEIIAELESTTRGIYTGCIGYIAPGRHSQFNIAIRTAVVNRARNTVEYGVGSGIVWDSRSQSEYEECLLKARIVTDTAPPFSLLETLLWEPAGGYFLVEEHLRRIAESADYFGMQADIALVSRRLQEFSSDFPRQSQRVRLLVDRDGRIRCEAIPLTDSQIPVRLGIAADPVNPADPFLYNKTTHRDVYDRAKAARVDCDDVVLWNERGEITETTIANIVVELDGNKFTPPVESGLLAGVFRDWLLRHGEITERRIDFVDLRRASRIWVVNSVRKWRDAMLVGHDGQAKMVGPEGLEPSTKGL
jgi:para-aminobenzoate synthetase/4-amino-4-deoxychorismate lyase